MGLNDIVQIGWDLGNNWIMRQSWTRPSFDRSYPELANQSGRQSKAHPVSPSGRLPAAEALVGRSAYDCPETPHLLDVIESTARLSFINNLALFHFGVTERYRRAMRVPVSSCCRSIVAGGICSPSARV